MDRRQLHFYRKNRVMTEAIVKLMGEKRKSERTETYTSVSAAENSWKETKQLTVKRSSVHIELVAKNLCEREVMRSQHALTTKVYIWITYEIHLRPVHPRRLRVSVLWGVLIY